MAEIINHERLLKNNYKYVSNQYVRTNGDIQEDKALRILKNYNEGIRNKGAK